MGIAIRQSIITAIISYVGVVVGYISLLYLYPKFLTPEQIGLLRTIQDAAMLMVPFATMGLAQGIVRYYPQYSKSKDQINSFVGLMIVLAFAGFVVFLLLFYAFESTAMAFFEENASAVIQYKNLILGLIFLLLFTTLFEQLSKSMLKVAFPGFLRDIVIRVLQVVLILLFHFQILSFHQFIISSVLIYVITLAALVWFIRRNKVGLSFSGFNTFPPHRVKEILTFSSMSFISVGAMILIGKTDSLMVTGFLGLAEVAVYTTAYYMATVIEIPKRAITQAAQALLAHAFEQGKMEQVSIIYRKTSLNQLIIGALLMIGVWANIDHIFDLMPKGDTYRSGASVVILIGLAKLIDMAFGPSSEIIGLSRYYKFNLLCVAVLAVIVVGCNYVFIPKFGLVGAAYGSVIALLVFNVVKYFFIYLTFRLQPFTSDTLKVLFISGLVLGLNTLLPTVANLLIDVAYRSFVITFVFSTMILISNASDDVNKLFKTMLIRFGMK
jgi:O-antigen/teichoic acid export membrane protein